MGAMSGSTLFYIAFAAVMVAILVIVGAALVLEAGEPASAPGPEQAGPVAEPAGTAGAEREAA
jgi:hypothetical protein